jgi:thiamine-monophosphate kinase
MPDEFTRIAAIAARVPAGGAGVALGIGDDAAVLAPLAGRVVLTVDAAVEGVHFVRAWASLRVLGRRAVMAAVSDLAAMGAAPRATLVALALPDGLDDADLLALVDGTADAATETGAALVGGNLTRASELSITTTAVGEAGARVLTRSGAREGDAVYVTGVVGAAALGLAHLQSGRAQEPEAAPFVARWCAPIARLTEGRALVDAGATACVDVSDGLLQDLGHLARASGLAARVDAAALPMLPGQTARATALGLDAVTLALTGGEDYELVYAGPASPALASLGTRIGALVAGPAGAVTAYDVAGAAIALTTGGYAHFRP